MAKKIHKIINAFCWVPFVLAFVGYHCADGGADCEILPFWDSVYAAASLYYVNPVSDNSNGFIITAKIMAIIVTTSLLLSLLSIVFDSLSHWWDRRWKDSTTVYTDNVWGRKLAGTLKHGYTSKEADTGRVEKTKSHIIMYSDDMKNLNFYEEHRNELEKRDVFISLNHIDSYLLKSADEDNVRFFNVYDSFKDSYKLAIIGYGDVGKAVFKYGYLNNIYNLDQKIEYHIWGCDKYNEEYLENLVCGNDDSIFVHKSDYRDDIKLLSEMQRVIVTDGDVIEIMQNLMWQNPSLNIDCYSEEGTDFSEFFGGKHISMFGDTTEILTEKNIKEERLYEQAKLVNYDYCLRYEKCEENSLPDNYEHIVQEKWKKLSGFLRGSNIARADYCWIEKKNIEKGFDEETIWRLEHIRWCRYHYYNRWSCGEKKDKEKRQHNLLVPFDDLPYDEKKKDGIYNAELKKRIEELI
jgi:hypothetical protein